MLKLIIHIDEQSKWPQVCNNLNNLIKAKQNGTNIFIELIVTGKAVLNILLPSTNCQKVSSDYEDELFNTLKKSNQNGIDLMVCNNSLKEFNVNKLELCKYFKIVPVGLVEIAKKESQGYGYVKP